MPAYHRPFPWTYSIGIMALILSLGFLLNGCAGLMKNWPDQPAYQSMVIETLKQKYPKPESIPSDPDKMTADQRNIILEDLIFLVDVNYHRFESDLYKKRVLFDTTTDLAIIGLGALGTLIDSSGTQAILAAISTAISGGKVTISKNYFHE